MRFGENYFYYDENFDLFEDVELSTFDSTLQIFWSSRDDVELNIKRRHSKKVYTFITFDFMLKKRFEIKKNFFDDDEFQNVFEIDLNRNFVSQNIMFASKQTESSKTSIVKFSNFNNDEKNNENEKSNEEIITNKNSNEEFLSVQTSIFAFFTRFAKR